MDRTPATPIDIGSRRELFVDRLLVDTLDGASLKLHPPVRREVVFEVLPPFENACTGCYNLVRDDDRTLLYYRGFYPIGEAVGDLGETQTTGLVISQDGIHFERPVLRLVEFNGSKENNIVWQGIVSHNMCVFKDGNPDARSDERFKAVGGTGTDSLYGLASPDGIHWRTIQDAPLAVTGAFDSVNVPLWDPHAGCYRLFSRYWEGDWGVRAIQSCTSQDFRSWTTPVPHQYGEGVPREHFYTNATTPCPGAEHILLSFPMRFLGERTKDTDGMDYPGEGVCDAVFITSRDGEHWDRTFMEAWVRPGPDRMNWTHRNQTPAVGIVPTAPDEWSMYIAEHYGWSDHRLRRVTVRPHGFASINAGYAGGEVVTRPFVFSGETLRLNYSTSAAGSVTVAVMDAAGTPLPGLDADDMDPMFGDALDEPVRWREGGDLSAIAGQPVRLRFRLRDADVFAFRVQ